MFSQDLIEALDASDAENPNERLSQLASADFGAGISPATAQAYLRTFCDNNPPYVKRRWVGIIICKMLRTSADVVSYLKCSTNELTGVGEVVLNKTELEETKIVAGLIIREGMARGIKFLSFWPSDKVQNSTSNFPRDAGPKWMGGFQDFLETLASLRITERVTDSDLFFVIALFSSDGYKWKEPNDVASVLIQRQNLSIMTVDPMLQHFNFVDLPLSHIRDVRRKQTTLHDSQGRQNPPEPWDIVLQLKSGPWTFCVNSIKHTGNEFSIMFPSADDAKECEMAIHDLLQPPPMRASSQSICISRTANGELCGDTTARVAQQIRSAQADIDEIELEKSDDFSLKYKATKAADTRISPSKTKRAHLARTAALSQDGGSLDPAFQGPKSKLLPGCLQTETTMDPKALSCGTASHGQDLSKSGTECRSTKKTGALPTMRKPATSNVTTRNLPVETEYDSFDFPEELPRIKRPKLATSKGPTRLRAGGAATRKPVNGVRSSVASAKSKSKSTLQDTQAKSAEDNHSPSQSPARIANKFHSHHNEHERAKPKIKGPGGVGSNSHLPRIFKTNATEAAKPQQIGLDEFAIPEDDDNSSKPQRRSKRRRVVYKEPNTSSEEDLDSEYTENKRRKARASVARTQAPKMTRSHKATNSAAKKVITGSTTESLSAAAFHIGRTNPLPVSESQATQSAQFQKNTTHITTEIRRKKGSVPGVIAIAGPSTQPTSIHAKSEIVVLNRLNEQESGDAFNTITNHEPEFIAHSLKRPPDSPPPATPPHTKRPKPGYFSASNHTKQHGSLVVRASATSGPLRVLAEPSSPCSKQRWHPSPQVATRTEDSMRAPAVPKSTDATRSARRQSRQGVVESKKSSDRRATPLHRLGKRTHSGSSVNVELLSSNSKPTPASPSAESTAISGHADPHHLDLERAIGEHEIAKNDPFNLRSNASKLTSFTRRLTGNEQSAFDEPEVVQGNSYELPIEIGDDSFSDESSDGEVIDEAFKQYMTPSLVRKASHTPDIVPSQAKEPARRSRSCTAERPAPGLQGSVKHDATVAVEAMDDSVGPSLLQQVQETESNNAARDPNASPGLDSDTLVEQENQSLPQQKSSPILFRSSPPALDGSPSSHSSTSAENEPRTDPPIPPSEAEEIEWAATLQPHQRSLHDQLLRVSSRVVRHVVDSEVAVDSIADTFARDAHHLLDAHVQRHDEDLAAMVEDVEKKKGQVKNGAEALLKRLKRGYKALDD